MLTVSSQENGEMVRVTLDGRLDGSESCHALPMTVKDHIDAGHLHFTLDLDRVEWMSSWGIGSLISTYASVRRAGGNLILANPNERVLATLRVTDLVPGVFEVIAQSRTAPPARG